MKIFFLVLFLTLKLFAVREVINDHSEYEITKNEQPSRLYMNLGNDSLQLSEKILRSRLVKISLYDVRSLVKLGYLRNYYYHVRYLPAKVLKTVHKSIIEDVKLYDDLLAGVYGEDIDPSSFGNKAYINMKKKSSLKNMITKKILTIDDNIQRKVKKELFNYCTRYLRGNNSHKFVIPWYKANYYRAIRGQDLREAIGIIYPCD
jgi:hypothetical protein